MKDFLKILLAGLLIAAFGTPALAWEFSMKGEYEYRFRYFGRTGDTDLFGIASLQDTAGGAVAAPTFVGFAGPTLYNRGRIPATNMPSSNNVMNGSPGVVDAFTGAPAQLLITRGGFSRWGSDALYNDSRLTMYPEIKVNPAVRISAVLNIGGYRNKYFQNFGVDSNGIDSIGTPPFERYYMSQTSMNAHDTAATISVEQFRSTIQMPVGILSVGVKDFPFGTGATVAKNTRAEELLMVVPYGPFKFLGAIWLSRGRFVEGWQTVPDGDIKNRFFAGFAAIYGAGDLDMGVLSIYRAYHQKKRVEPFGGPASPDSVAGKLGLPINGLDDTTWANIVYLKYFNGRFFLNSEYAWVNVDQYLTGAPAGVPLVNSGNVHLEAYHFFNELGVVCGPARMTLVYALVSGRVLNNNNPTKFYSPWAMNYQVMQPYQLLMFDTFAGGNNGGWNPGDVTFVSDDHGLMTNAYAYATRLDYAVASNLNVWGSFIWAHRLERAGFLKGGIEASGRPLNPASPVDIASHNTFVTANFGAASALVGGPIDPYTDNGYLGWEANAGVDWKLLEGVTTYFRYSYWQPGDWFTQALQAIGVNQAAGGISQNALVKGRDAIQAFTGSLVIDF